MPPSRVGREETLSSFDTCESVTRVARQFGVTKQTLKRWWVSEFGEAAYLERVRVEPQTKEKKRETRRRYRRRNRALINTRKRLARARNLESERSRARLRFAQNETLRNKRSTLAREYYRTHREQQLSYHADYRNRNREALREKAKSFNVDNPHVVLCKLAKQRAHRWILPCDIDADYVKSITPKLCPITLLPFKRGDRKPTFQSMTLDKIVPSLGYVKGNVAVISRLANTIKQDCTDPQVFRAVAAYLQERSVLPVRPSLSKRTPASQYAVEKALLASARQRAKNDSLEFAIILADVVACYPEDGKCPITSLPLQRGVGRPWRNSPSLDRVDPTQGYVPGNVRVISYWANTIKSNVADPEVFLRLARYVEDSLECL